MLFDLDGTLCYYTLSVEQVLDRALRRAQIAAEVLGDLRLAAARYAELWGDVQETLESTERIRLHIMERLLAERGSNDATCAARLSDAYGAVREESGVRLFGGAAELLRDMKRRCALGLLTNGPSDMQWAKIRSLGLDGLFDATVVAGDVGLYKPDVRAFELLLDRLHVRASCALFVGDSFDLDVVGAHRAGLRTAWIRRDGASPAEGIVPDLEIAGVASLREVLL